MPSLSDLLDDPNATLEVIVGGSYLDSSDVLHTVYFSRSGWADPPSGEYGYYMPPLLDLTLHVSQSIDPLEPSTLLEGPYSEIRLINNSIYTEYIGLFDPYYQYSVDHQPWNLYLVGILSTGQRVELSDVLSTPLYTLIGVDIPEVSSSECIIRVRSLSQILDTPLQPVTYSPPCLLFPGTTSGVVDLGDNLDITGVQSLSAWVYLEDPVTTTQYILFKDGTTTGYYLAVGLVGGGAIAAGVEIAVRGQSPATSTTAANVLRPFQSYRIDISIDTTSRRIDIDGTTALTTTSITGTPTGNSVSLTIGRSLTGRIHRVLYWSNARSNATMSAEGRIPITGAESNLREAFLFGEGSGSTTTSIKSGSVLTGTLHSSVLWDNASWNYESILGQHEPYVLGTVPRVPVTWIDPPKQIGQVSRGAIAILSELQSNHGAVSSSNYTVNLTNGTFTVTSGSLSGNYSATVTANNLWNSALLFNGTSSRAEAAITMPAGVKYLAAHFRVHATSASSRQIAGWNATPGFIIRLDASATNRLVGVVRNDAGADFNATCPFQIKQNKRYTVFLAFDPSTPSTALKLYVNAVLVATTAVSGTFNNTASTLRIGSRTSIPDLFFPGIIDEIVVGNTAATLTMVEAHFTKPVTSSFTGIIHGWHFDEGGGSSAAPFAGAVSCTLTNIGWDVGRSAPTDLARAVLFNSNYGFSESDLDYDSWLEALKDCVYDCGWFVGNGTKGTDVLNIILGGLGFILLESFGKFKLLRFEGISGTADVTFNPVLDSISEEVIAQPCDPAVYQWVLDYYTNNLKLDPANILGSLATSDPARYSYGSKESLSVTKNDYAVLDRFPGALSKRRKTAMLLLRDVEEEALRLLTLHKEGADKKSVAMFVRLGTIEVLDEISPLQGETDLRTSNLIVRGIEIDEDSGRLIVWRPVR